MSELTFIGTASNNGSETAQKHFTLSVESLLNQEISDIRIWLRETSKTGKELEIPDDDRIEIIRGHIPIEKLNLAHIRNTGATSVKDKLIAHINFDCIYAANITQHIVKLLKKHNLVQCRRHSSFEDQVGLINSYEDAKRLLPKIWLDREECCGDLQSLKRDFFISKGGYYNRIDKKSVAHPGDYVTQSRREDTYLYRKLISQVGWIGSASWILHLWHPKRKSSIAVSEAQHLEKL